MRSAPSEHAMPRQLVFIAPVSGLLPGLLKNFKISKT